MPEDSAGNGISWYTHLELLSGYGFPNAGGDGAEKTHTDEEKHNLKSGRE